MRASFVTQCGVGILVFAVILLVRQEIVRAQDAGPKTFSIEFKVFPANDPTGSPLDPFEVATIHYRNKVEDLPDVKFDLPVNAPKPNDAQKLYWVEVQEGWLIDNLVIRVKGAVNPAVVTKLVTRDNMVLYPGASDSGDTFKFPAYMTQMGTYRSLFREFVEEAPPSIREPRRTNLLAAFEQQLENMSDVRIRVPAASESEIATATKLKDEVIKLYFGSLRVTPSRDCRPPELKCYNCLRPQVCCCPARRCGLFGRFHCRGGSPFNADVHR